MVPPVSSSLRLLVALAAALATAAATSPASAQTVAERPNILMIMTDDQTVESMRVMPSVQRLIADRGTTFTTMDREVPVQVTVPTTYDKAAQWANEFSDTVVKTDRSITAGVPSGCP